MGCPKDVASLGDDLQQQFGVDGLDSFLPQGGFNYKLREHVLSLLFCKKMLLEFGVRCFQGGWNDDKQNVSFLVVFLDCAECVDHIWFLEHGVLEFLD